MTGTPHRPLIVGLDGSVGDDVAARWAAEEAVLSDLPLLLLGSYTTASADGAACTVPSSPAWNFDQQARHQARRSVDVALRMIESEYPAVHVTGRVVRGKIYDALLALAKHADTVIVGCPGGEQHISRVGMLGQPLTKRSSAPVVITPSDVCTRPDGEVLVGLTIDADAHTVLAYAFEHARRHAAPIRIVCGWPPRRSAFTAQTTMTYHETEERLFDTLAMWHVMYPDVPVSSSVVAAHPTSRMIVDAEHACLLVLGGRRRRTDWAVRHRVQRLLNWTRRPVAVVPTGPVG